MFNLDFLSLKFSQKNYIVNENIPGGKQNITIQRCIPYCLAGSGSYSSFVEYQIGDGPTTGLPEILSNPRVNLRGTSCPFLGGCASSATGRQDCLTRSAGLEECLWLPSSGKSTHFASYDSLGLSDYAPFYGPLSFLNGTTSATIDVVITNDDIFESPDEHVNVRLIAPGFATTYGGNYGPLLLYKMMETVVLAQRRISIHLHLTNCMLGMINLDIRYLYLTHPTKSLPLECTVHQIKRPRMVQSRSWVSNGQL